MIITRVPLRMSFVGGGTDLKVFYEKDYGEVLSTTINQYIYITVKKQTKLVPDKFRIGYSKTENVNQVADIEHPIVREILGFLKINFPLEIKVMADIPARTGLGSSSSFTVGLLHALHALRGESISPYRLAEEAGYIELNCLKRAIGKQDHYAAAFGGLNKIKFMPDESVIVSPILCPRTIRENFFNHLALFYTFKTRDAESILKGQQRDTAGKWEILKEIRDSVHRFESILEGNGNFKDLGKILEESWQKKKTLHAEISNESIDKFYQKAKKIGALGGKLLGAGGGGFLLFVIPPAKQGVLEKELKGMLKVDVKYEP